MAVVRLCFEFVQLLNYLMIVGLFLSDNRSPVVCWSVAVVLLLDLLLV